MAEAARLDTVREVHTPEGVALRLPAAGPVPRAAAWVIDLAIRLALLMMASMFLGLLDRTGMGVYLIIVFLVLWAYPVVFEAMWHGQTPGKRALGLRVVAADGTPIGWMASFVRNLMRTVDMMPFGYGFGLASSLIDPWGRRLGDIVARTVVIHVLDPRGRVDVGNDRIMTPLLPLQPQEQAAVVAFAERASRLTPQRQQELADIAVPVTGARGPAAVERLLAIANWLLGRRA